jgi:hypothetical protein
MDNYTILNENYQYTINTASLKLRGDIASQQGNYEEALLQKKDSVKAKKCILLLVAAEKYANKGFYGDF